MQHKLHRLTFGNANLRSNNSEILSDHSSREEEIKVLKIKKLSRFNYRNDVYEICFDDTQDFIFKLESEVIYTVEFVSKRDRKIKRFFDKQYFKLTNEISFVYRGNKLRYNVELRRINEDSPYLYTMVQLQKGNSNPEILLDRITNTFSSYTRRSIGEWIAKYPELVHERYKDVTANIILLSKLEDNDDPSIKVDNGYYHQIWQDKGGDGNESV